MLIRPAVPDDAEAIAEVNAAAWKAAFAGVVSEEYLSSYDGAPQRRREDLLTMSSEAVQFVAEDGNRVVGWLLGHPSEDEDCHRGSVYEVRACYVAPTHWRAGAGRRLMQHLLTGLDRSRWREVVLWTPRDTAPTRAFYASLGFESDGKTAVMDRLGPVPIVRLRRTLTEDVAAL
ncbi:GNAT family N-acetyltransferase [Kineococcus sp. NBC_00420]|uniref:GNAT family N-acetyltransferase n=1 Tax=Kineococcus sp. NBC_00420 TaxID=2903564 RepID=UPI002E23B442